MLFNLRSQGGGVWSPRLAHNQETAGSNPAPATASRGRIGFDVSGRAQSSQRVAAYRSGPEGNASANDKIASEAADGIAELEAMLAEKSDVLVAA